MRARSIPLLAALVASACAPDEAALTHLHVRASFDPSIQIDQLRLELLDEPLQDGTRIPLIPPTLRPEAPGPLLRSGDGVAILLSDAKAGRRLTLQVAGLRQGMEIVRGEAAAMAVAGQGVDVLVGLGLGVEPRLVALSVTPTNPTLAQETSVQLQATGVYSDGGTLDLTRQAAWASSAESVVTVGDSAEIKGLARAHGSGAATVTARLGEIVGATVISVAGEPLRSLTIEPPSPRLPVGGKEAMRATGTFSNGRVQDLTASVAWTSSSEAVAQVCSTADCAGQLTALSAGSTTVVASLGEVRAEVVAVVTSASLSSLRVEPANASIAAGTTLQMTATGEYSDGTARDLTTLVTWATSSAAVATASNTLGAQGLVQGLSVGRVTISAVRGEVRGEATLDVSTATLQAIDVSPATHSLPVGGTVRYQAKAVFSDGSSRDYTQQVTWASSSPAVATVSNATGGGMGSMGSSKGTAKGLQPGTTTISAAHGGTSGKATLTVQ